MDTELSLRHPKNREKMFYRHLLAQLEVQRTCSTKYNAQGELAFKVQSDSIILANAMVQHVFVICLISQLDQDEALWINKCDCHFTE